MVGIVVAVFLMSTAKVKSKDSTQPTEPQSTGDLEPPLAE